MTIEVVTTVKVRAVEVSSQKIEDLLEKIVARFSSAAGCLNCLCSRRFSKSPEWILSVYWANRNSMEMGTNSLDFHRIIKEICNCASEVSFRCFFPGER